MKINLHPTRIHIFILGLLYFVLHYKNFWGLALNGDELCELLNVGYLHGFPLATPQQFGVGVTDLPMQATRLPFYWLLNAWTTLVGFGILNIRCLSIILGFFCLLLVYLLGCELFSDEEGFFGALSLIFCLPFIEHTAIARFEPAYWLFWILTIYLVVKFGSSSNKMIHCGIGIVAGAAILTHPRAWAVVIQAIAAYMSLSKNPRKTNAIFIFTCTCAVFFLVDWLLIDYNLILAATPLNGYRPTVLSGCKIFNEAFKIACFFFDSTYQSFRWGGRSGEICWRIYASLTAFSLLHLVSLGKKYSSYFKLYLPAALFMLMIIPGATRFWINSMWFLALANGVFLKYLIQITHESIKNMATRKWLSTIVAIFVFWTFKPEIFTSIESIMPLLIFGFLAFGASADNRINTTSVVASTMSIFCMFLYWPEFVAAWLPSCLTMRTIFFAAGCCAFVAIHFFYFAPQRKRSLRWAYAIGLLVAALNVRQAYAIFNGHDFALTGARPSNIRDFLTLPNLAPLGTKIIGDDMLWWAHHENHYYGIQSNLVPDFADAFRDPATLRQVALQFKPDYFVMEESTVISLFRTDKIFAWWLRRLGAFTQIKYVQDRHTRYYVVAMHWPDTVLQ